ncbi:GNAT family N-acetyltransferase [Aquirufa sp. OSTEICH-129V]|uniref:GNAT family N-acetyltransferase n=1 Tax=Aquirufa avitistagni TaxID=3104728 RepID=A0ABW6DD51_9BACT
MESRINKITQALSPADIDLVFAIRTEVFVVEQKCLPKEEFDELDAVAIHYLYWVDGQPVATGRYRKKEKGIKIERIATLAPYRGKGYASEIVRFLIQEAQMAYPEVNYFYLHAQQTVMPLYASLGFEPYGKTFIEADIVHQAMSLTL